MKQTYVLFGRKSDGSDARRGVYINGEGRDSKGRPELDTIRVFDKPSIAFDIGTICLNRNMRSDAERFVKAPKRRKSNWAGGFYLWMLGERDYETISRTGKETFPSKK